jgi:hypothetical protein
MSFPEMPPELRAVFPNPFWNWWQAFKSWVNTKMETQGDITISTAAKGLVLVNAAGTITKRIRLNDAGTGIIIEDV